MNEGFFKAISKMFNAMDASNLREQWLDFSNLRGPTFGRPEAKTDRSTLAQRDPIGWWTWHGRDTPELRVFAIRLLSQVASSSAAERNWSTYSFIQSIKRNNLSSKRSEKLVACHSVLRLCDRQTPQYRQTPALRWDVNPEDAMKVEEDDTPLGLVGVPLDEDPLPIATTDSKDDDADLDLDIDLDS